MPTWAATALQTLACLNCLTLSMVSRADCVKAHDHDRPHGANELIQLQDMQVDRIFGTIFFPNDETAKDIVVEVYRQTGNQGHGETIRQKRVAACVTGVSGKFSFPKLKPGKYLLQAGVREQSGVNITYVIVDVRSKT